MVRQSTGKTYLALSFRKAVEISTDERFIYRPCHSYRCWHTSSYFLVTWQREWFSELEKHRPHVKGSINQLTELCKRFEGQRPQSQSYLRRISQQGLCRKRPAEPTLIRNRPVWRIASAYDPLYDALLHIGRAVGARPDPSLRSGVGHDAGHGQPRCSLGEIVDDAEC